MGPLRGPRRINRPPSTPAPQQRPARSLFDHLPQLRSSLPLRMGRGVFLGVHQKTAEPLRPSCASRLNKRLAGSVASSALWSLPHIPSKPLEQLLGGIFLGGLLFGYVCYKTKSILLPAWLHVVANSGYLAGIWIAGLYCLIGFADWAIWSSSKQNPPAVAAQGTSPLST